VQCTQFDSVLIPLCSILIGNLLAEFLDDIKHLLTVLGFFFPLQTTSQINPEDMTNARAV
jgi:hypothetical protein